MFCLGLTTNLCLAARDISLGILTPGDFVMLQALFMQIAMPLHFMGTIFREIDESHVQVEALFNILDMKSKVTEKEDAKPYDYQGGTIEFKNVNYTYEKEKGEMTDMLKNFNLKIEGGTSNAIVGPSGFGKSTIFNMIYRLLDPDRGDITFDGQNLKDLQLDTFRE